MMPANPEGIYSQLESAKFPEAPTVTESYFSVKRSRARLNELDLHRQLPSVSHEVGHFPEIDIDKMTGFSGGTYRRPLYNKDNPVSTVLKDELPLSSITFSM